MAFDIHRRSSDILQKGQVGFNGLVVPDNRNIERTFTLVGGQASQVQPITIGGSPAATDTVSFTISRAVDSSSAAFSFTLPALSSGSYTAATAAQAIVDAFNADASFTKMAFATRDGNDVVLTAIFPGADYVFAVTVPAVTGGITAALGTATAGADATDALFGDVLLGATRGESNFLNVAADFGHNSARVGEVLAGKFPYETITGDTATIEVTAVTGSSLAMVTVSRMGKAPESYTFTTVAGDTAATAAALEAAIDGGTLATASTAGSTVTATAATLGPRIHVSVSPLGSGLSVTIAEQSQIVGGLEEQMLGVVVYDPTDADTDVMGSNSTGVKAGTEGRMLEEGYFLFKPTDSAALADVLNKAVYVGQNGAEKGRIFLTAGAPADKRVLWLRCIVKQAVRGGFYVLRLLPFGAQ